MSPQPIDSFSPTSLEHVLDQNEAIQESVGESAAELCVIHAVLQHEVPDSVKTGDVAQALQKTDELEERIQASADNLEQVNHTLKEQIQMRAELEQQLALAKTALEQAQNAGQNRAPASPRSQQSPRSTARKVRPQTA